MPNALLCASGRRSPAQHAVEVLHPALFDISPERGGHRFPLTQQEQWIGRDPRQCSIVIDDPMAGRLTCLALSRRQEPMGRSRMHDLGTDSGHASRKSGSAAVGTSSAANRGSSRSASFLAVITDCLPISRFRGRRDPFGLQRTPRSDRLPAEQTDPRQEEIITVRAIAAVAPSGCPRTAAAQRLFSRTRI